DLHFHRVNTEHILAVPYDVPMIGANTEMVNTLRLWSAEPADDSPTWMSYQKYLSEVNQICENLYPDDSTPEGKYLRLKQQYFFVAAGLASIVEDHKARYGTLDNLADKVSIQLNDTHPVLAIPELLRILMDNNGYSWNQAWEITRNVMSYTNHTVMAEALETWPCEYLRNLLPRIFMIIEELDRRFTAYVNENYPGDPNLLPRVSIINGGMVHMARMAVIGSHSVNGVAKIHSGLLTTELFSDYYMMWPERFNNKTNGITPRRFMLYSNPELRQFLNETIGKSYQKDFSKIIKLMDYVDDPKVQEKFLEVKRQRKQILADHIKEDIGVELDVNSIFDSQAKRLHSYKRQLLNVMHIIYLYQRIKSDPNFKITPQTYIFAAKAAPSYVFAKKVIKLINCISKVINNDPDVKGMLKVVFLPNYSVSMSEVLMNGSDVSEQISTAGKEASGTGNMKFMMNGAITLGTLDGATVEIDDLVGRENDVIFGLTVDQIGDVRRNYRAWDYFQNDERIRKVMNSLIDGTWNGNKDDFRAIYDEILVKNDEYLVLADFDAYVKAHEEIEKRYADPHQWAKSCLINIAKSAYFSSDRTIAQYAEDIWNIKPLKI
ncbi:MAG: glycogen/starch/alpha-glucan phosphorylase, partial [Solobacterium sp.]|nr:glycogen/starch/alpha-glucan phosphorylase [Solobacterium sp.]